MIESLHAVLIALASAVQGAQGMVRIETQAIAAPSVIMALEGARKRGVPVSVVLGAKAEYTLDAKGQPTGGNRPYDSGPQGMELRALDAMKAAVFIPPRFSELDRPVFEPGIELNASFAIVDSRRASLCTGAFSIGNAGVCWTTSDPGVVSALIGLHDTDRTDGVSESVEASVSKKLAAQDMILTPANSADFLLLLRQPWKQVVASHLGDGSALEALLASRMPATLWTAPNGTYARTALDRLRRAGWQIRQLPQPFSGTVLVGSKMAYIGSQKVEQAHLEKSRGLGIVLGQQHIARIEQTLQLQ
ncbi:hypothetical protein RQP54_18395 [Curvibacter sp. APW13]|uniref:hypothetical protein n=1 Tax=Curvibacter sp. APW13 TaxID=3077236 RepID=UPI0028DF5BAF|nr:hypothetical protein [Curvibacter sp. APW13]MDT8992850.1 hypothetical protein [Curvibacter sp. APW13]